MTTHHLQHRQYPPPSARRSQPRGSRGWTGARAPAALQQRTKVKRNFVACLNYPLPKERKRTNRASKTCAILPQDSRSFARITRILTSQHELLYNGVSHASILILYHTSHISLLRIRSPNEEDPCNTPRRRCAG